MAFTYVTVTCDYDLADGTDPAGTVTFTLTEAATNSGVVNYPAPVAHQIDIDGVLSIDLAANTDPDTSPTGTAYKVVEHLNSVTRTYYVEIPHDAGSSVALSSLTPLVAAPGLVGYLTQTVADDRYLSIAAGSGSSGGAAGLAIARGAFATRVSGARPIVYLGDSITAGRDSSDAAHRWVNVLTARLQAEYPLAGSSPSMWASVAAAVAAAPLSAGVQGVNAGIASRTSADYVDSSDIVEGIGTIEACLVFHTIGTNDCAAQTALATYKTNIQTQIAAIKAVSTVPCLHVLVHLMDRTDIAAQAITWADYGTAMDEVAAADADGDVVYFDLNGAFLLNRWPGTDPFDLLLWGAGVHPTDNGHVLIADLLFGALLAPPVMSTTAEAADPVVNTVLPAITGTATEDETLTASTGTWTPTPDSYTYRWKRNGVAISSATNSTYVLVTADVGSVITVAVTAAKSGYSSDTAISAATDTVASAGGGGATVTDTFTRANSGSTPGTTETGSLTWTVLQGGTWGISSNQLVCAAAVDSSCVVDTSAADGTIAFTLPGSGLNRGIAARMSADGSQGYVIWRNDSSHYQLAKKNSGYTTLATSTGVTPAADDVLSVVLAGNSITVKANGVTAIATTDATYATNTRHGAWAFNSSDLFDGFSFTP